MNSHTRTEWKLETVPTQVGVCHKIGPFPSRGARPETYACVYVDGYPAGLEGDDSVSAELRANAVLMRAAPTMLEALKGLELEVGGMLEMMRECVGNTNVAVIQTRLSAARAAIRQATGEGS